MAVRPVPAASGETTARQRCAILLNERAAAMQRESAVEELRELCAGVGLDAELIPTSTPEEMRARIRALVSAGTERIAVAGGDGTVAHAVQELAHTGSVLGILPQGTANNFATALRLPQDLSSALRILREGVVREVDLGRVGDRYFTEAAGVGLFADGLALYGPGSNKQFLRGAAAILRVLTSYRAHQICLTVDGELHTERAVMCTVANSYRMGLAAPVAPQAKVTDGTLDVVILGELNLPEVFTYYRAIRAQIHLRLPKVTMMSAREVRIEARRPLNVHCDDDVIGTTPVTITAQPCALKVLVDRLQQSAVGNQIGPA
jgi:diacylglycerol kinase (ATP)